MAEIRLNKIIKQFNIGLQNLVDFYVSHPKVVNYLELLVGEVVDVKSIEDMDRAFEADMHKAKGKTILHWNV